MSQNHSDPIEQNIDSHPVKLAIVIVIGTIALIIGIILMAKFAIGVYGSRDLKNDPAMKAEVVAKRIAPVAQVAVDPNVPAVPAAPAVAAAAAPAPSAASTPVAASDGKKTYDAACTVCHTAGVAGAPKPGDKAAWAPRLAQGKEVLYASALKGKGAMPAKGGNAALSDADVRAAVDYLVANAK